MKIALLVALSLMPGYGHAQTVTLYDVGENGFIKSNVSISVEGVNDQGATIYSFEELKTVTITTNGVETVTLSELWAGTMVEDASRELLTILPTASGGRGAIASCTYGPDGLGGCIWEEWFSGSSTGSYSFGGSVFPFYTLVVTSTPTALEFDTTANTISGATVTSSRSGASISPSPSSNSTTPSSSGATTHIPIGPILGGILGGLVVLAFAVVLLYRRHRKKVNSENIEKLDLTDSDSENAAALVIPFPLPHGDHQSPEMTSQHHPIDPTRLTVDPNIMETHNTADSPRQTKADPSHVLIPSSAHISPAIKHSSPAYNSPAQNDSGNSSDLRPQLEALRAEVELLREQQSMVGFGLPPPRYTN